MSSVESGHSHARRCFILKSKPRSPASLQQRHAAPSRLRGGGLSGGPPPSDHARRVCGPRDRAEDGPGTHHQKHWNVSSLLLIFTCLTCQKIQVYFFSCFVASWFYSIKPRSAQFSYCLFLSTHIVVSIAGHSVCLLQAPILMLFVLDCHAHDSRIYRMHKVFVFAAPCCFNTSIAFQPQPLPFDFYNI